MPVVPREGMKLFLKGERCYGEKCAIERRNVPPGQHGKGRRAKLIGYGLQLREKQRVKRMYGVLERQFRRYFHTADRKKGITGEILLQLLESRLDNVVYRLGFATSRAQARQLVRHGHFLVNERRADIPSYLLRAGDRVIVKPCQRQEPRHPVRDGGGQGAWCSGMAGAERRGSTGRLVAVPDARAVGAPRSGAAHRRAVLEVGGSGRSRAAAGSGKDIAAMCGKASRDPRVLECDQDTLTDQYGRFHAQPFERGFGTTIGNALRRVLLSSIEGAAVTAVKIDGVLHEFSPIQGLRRRDRPHPEPQADSDPHPRRRHEDALRTGRQAGRGHGGRYRDRCGRRHPRSGRAPGDRGRGGQPAPGAPGQAGRGYVSADKNADEDLGIGWIPIDSVHSPIKKVNYLVEAARLGQTTDYDKLTVDVWTDGAVSARDAVSSGRA